MINAKEARNKVEEIRLEKTGELMSLIKASITKAINEAKTQTRIYNIEKYCDETTRPLIIDKLQNLGYKVEYNGGWQMYPEQSLIISW